MSTRERNIISVLPDARTSFQKTLRSSLVKRRSKVQNTGARSYSEKTKKEETKMKKLILIALIIGLFASYTYAQMTGQKGQMMEQKGMMG